MEVLSTDVCTCALTCTRAQMDLYAYVVIYMHAIGVHVHTCARTYVYCLYVRVHVLCCTHPTAFIHEHLDDVQPQMDIRLLFLCRTLAPTRMMDRSPRDFMVAGR